MIDSWKGVGGTERGGREGGGRGGGGAEGWVSEDGLRTQTRFFEPLKGV